MKRIGWALALLLVAVACSGNTQPETQRGEVINLLEYQNANSYVFECRAEGLIPTTYQWDFGDGNKTEVNTSQIPHTYEYSGTYKVKCKATDGKSETTTELTVRVSVPAAAGLRNDDSALALSSRIASNMVNGSKKEVESDITFNDSDFDMVSYETYNPATLSTQQPSRPSYSQEEDEWDDMWEEDTSTGSGGNSTTNSTPHSTNSTSNSSTTNYTQPIINVNVNITIVQPVPPNITVEVPTGNTSVNITVPITSNHTNETEAKAESPRKHKSKARAQELDDGEYSFEFE
jgi:hypothetical protein